MSHPKVKEAAVIGIPAPEVGRAAAGLRRPQARARRRPRRRSSTTSSPLVAKWWLPDAVEFIDEVPKTSVGKFSKKDLRTQFAEYQLEVLRDFRAQAAELEPESPDQRTKGGWPVSLTMGRPAASHSPMPPPTLTAS